MDRKTEQLMKKAELPEDVLGRRIRFTHRTSFRYFCVLGEVSAVQISEGGNIHLILKDSVQPVSSVGRKPLRIVRYGKLWTLEMQNSESEAQRFNSPVHTFPGALEIL